MGDSNSRPLDPQPSALPTVLIPARLHNYKIMALLANRYLAIKRASGYPAPQRKL